MGRRPKLRKQDDDHALLDLDRYEARLLATVLAHIGGAGRPVDTCHRLYRRLARAGFIPLRYGPEIEVGKVFGERRHSIALRLYENRDQQRMVEWAGKGEVEPIANKVPLDQTFKFIRKIDLED